MRADNAGPHTMENARRKAYTALSFSTATSEYAKRYADNNPVVRQQVTLPSVIAIPGGLPGEGGQRCDRWHRRVGLARRGRACVQAGLDKIADQLQ